MSRSDRGFTQLGILPCSHQPPADRFPPKCDVKAPYVLSYRNNLTALSQCRNLLFMAYVDKLHVYKPLFPSQRILSKPELILDLPKTGAGRSGCIDPHHPHAVNHLVVGDLGHEEIVAVACDDGDVVALTTRSIQNAIEHQRRGQESDVQLSTDIRTVLLRNVGKSAWGLAIHKVARLIAVSSNTHNISVFAFALCREPSPESSRELGDGKLLPFANLGPGLEEWMQSSTFTHTSTSRSTRNLEIILKGHTSNIPSISFCNTDADPDGRYLVSTEIGGSTLVWNIWQKKVLAPMRSCQRPSASQFNWSVTCLDPYSCRLSGSISETFGCPDVSGCSAPDYFMGTPSLIFDNSPSAKLVPDSSLRHPSFMRQSVSPVSQPVVSAELIAVMLEEEGDYTDSDDEEEHDDSNSSSLVGSAGSEASLLAPQGPDVAMANTSITQVNSMEVDARIGTSNFPPSNGTNDLKAPSLPFNILQTSTLDIRLISNAPTYATYSKIVTCERALHQKLPPALVGLFHLERLNMVLQVPELGVVAIASQAGRVALLTMTKSTRGSEQYGFRIEWLLPLRSEEEKWLRPNTALMGMALGPVQGRGMTAPSAVSGDAQDQAMVADGSRRFRLMLTYYDHTILSYEIWRSLSDAGSGIQCRELVL